MTDQGTPPSDQQADRERLLLLVKVWHDAATETATLLRELDEDEWELSTDLPGWNVRAVAAHLAHLESDLAGNPQEPVEVPEAPHVHGLMGQFTEAGPIARASWPTERIVDEFESSVAKRYADLTTSPWTDTSGTPPGFPGLVGWSWETLLTNRPLDVWMHQQDVRRATDRPGGLDTAVAAHVAGVFAKALPFVLGKKAAAPPGSSVVLSVSGALPQTHAAAVGDNGRGVPLPEPPTDPTVRLELDFETWMMLAGGRRTADEVTVDVHGDPDLARRILDHLAVTP